jgi:putative ABC transport system permease protein
VLKGKSTLNNASGFLRKSLVVFQFMIAIVLVCGMIIISRQLNFMQQKDLGFESHQKIVVPLRTESAKKAYASLKSELSKSAGVNGVSAADFMPGTTIWNDLLLFPEGSTMDKAIYHPLNDIDYNYIDLLNIKLLAGRKFTDNRQVEQGKIIVSRASAKSFSYTPEEAIGKPLFMNWAGQTLKFEIIGVVDDFHQNSVKDVIKPCAFRMLRTEEWDTFENMIVSIETNDLTEVVDNVKATWKKAVNDTPFEYTFLEDDLQRQYTEDKRLSQIITSFTIIAMFISCLGLYGLSSYMAERRFKEIGVRKVMGASVNSIVGLMSREFLRLVLVAFALAVPLAWFVMNKWLAGFAYKISVGAAVFIYAGLSALAIALATVSFESVKAAMGNPVKALKNE